MQGSNTKTWLNKTFATVSLRRRFRTPGSEKKGQRYAKQMGSSRTTLKRHNSCRRKVKFRKRVFGCNSGPWWHPASRRAERTPRRRHRSLSTPRGRWRQLPRAPSRVGSNGPHGQQREALSETDRRSRPSRRNKKNWPRTQSGPLSSSETQSQTGEWVCRVHSAEIGIAGK